MRTLLCVLSVPFLVSVISVTVLAQGMDSAPKTPSTSQSQEPESTDTPPPVPPLSPKSLLAPPSTGPLGMFVRNRVVRDYLQLSDEQVKQFEEVSDQAWSDVLEKLMDITGGKPPHEWSPSVRRKVFSEMPLVMEEVTEDIVKKYESILQPGEQVQKARELAFLASEGIDFPMIGVAFLTVLNLTKEQKQEIRDIQAESRKKMRALIDGVLGGLREWEGNGSPIPEDTLHRFKEIGKETTQKIKEVLTEEQKQQADEIKKNGKDLMQQIIAANPKGPFGPPPPGSPFGPSPGLRPGPPPGSPPSPDSSPEPEKKREPFRLPWLKRQT
ncbi:MAG: hypothetical protein ACRC10_09715 [Thermoguttaceae bacterium]